MKIKKLMTTAALLVAVAVFTVTSSQALTSIQVHEIKNTVLSVPVPEMPAKAADLVTRADKKDRQAVAVTVVRAVVSKHKAAAPLIVSAISKVAPDLAPAVALAAAEIVKDQAPAIAHAAAVAAPAQASEISAVVPGSGLEPTFVTSRGAAGTGGSGGGTTTISSKPINQTSGGGGNTGNFPLSKPAPAGNGQVLYNQQPTG